VGTRGRTSRAALEVVGPAHVEAMARPSAPGYLTDEEAEEWVAIVERLAGDWFPRETHGLLADYCRHVVRGRRIAQLIEAQYDEGDVDVDRLDQLYKMAERESRAASSLATRLRITQQATVSPKAKKPSTVKKPWD
jgi:hypothetical protein